MLNFSGWKRFSVFEMLLMGIISSHGKHVLNHIKNVTDTVISSD